MSCALAAYTARAAARIRTHLIDGGYLHMTEFQTAEQATHLNGGGMIEELGLSAKAFDALIAAGVIPPAKRVRKRR